MSDRWADQMEEALVEVQNNNNNDGLKIMKKLFPLNEPPFEEVRSNFPINEPPFEEVRSRVGGRTTARKPIKPIKPITEAKKDYKNFKAFINDNGLDIPDLVKLITNHLSANFAKYGGFGHARCKQILKVNPLFTKKELHWNSWQNAIADILKVNNKNSSNLQDYYASSESATEDKINGKINSFLEELPLRISIFEASLTREEKKTKINADETINILNIESFNKALKELLDFATIDWSS